MFELDKKGLECVSEFVLNHRLCDALSCVRIMTEPFSGMACTTLHSSPIRVCKILRCFKISIPRELCTNEIPCIQAVAWVCSCHNTPHCSLILCTIQKPMASPPLKQNFYDLPKIVAIKLFLLPILCAFSARLSIVLFPVGMAGKGGVLS